jgi:hypothetical protein
MTTTTARKPPHAPLRAVRRKKAPARGMASGPGRNPAESPVAWLYSRRDGDGKPLITEAQFNAGERLRADFWFAQMTPNVTQSWSATAAPGSRRAAPGAGADIRDGIIAAADRVRRALAAVGPEHGGVLIDICCHLKGLEDVERRARWPRRSAKIVLGFALTALARHYGFEAAAREPRVAAVRHWGADGYRPALDADSGGKESQEP